MLRNAKLIFGMPHVASRLFGAPLAIARPKLDAILAALSSRLGIEAPASVEPKALEPGSRSDYRVERSIAVISVHGPLVKRGGDMDAMCGLTSYGAIGAELDGAMLDRRVAGIVLDIDSPGGEVSGMLELADKIYSARAQKPIYAVADDDAFSAAYALASAASKIYVARTGGVGSIGVVALHCDMSSRDQKQGLSYTYVHAGAKKVDGNPHEPLSDRAHAEMQAEIDRLYDMFVAQVSRNRGLDPLGIRSTEAGCYMGEAAVVARLADKVGGLDEAIADLDLELSSRARMPGRAARRTPMDFRAAVCLALGLAVDVTDETALATLKSKLDQPAPSAELTARVEAAEKRAAETEAKFTAELLRRDAEHEIEIAKREAVSLDPLAKDVEDDARSLFALGKPDMARRALARHLEAAKSKRSALSSAGKVQEEKKDPANKTKSDVMAEAKKQGAAIAAADPFTKVGA